MPPTPPNNLYLNGFAVEKLDNGAKQLNCNSHRLINLPDPTADTDAVNRRYVLDTVASLIDSAPDTLNTFKEFATAIDNNPSIATTFTSALTTETSRATDAEKSLSDRLDSEVSRATTAESSLASRLTSEVSRVQMLSSTTANTVVFTERSRAQAAEALLATIVSLNTEISRATNAEASLSSILAYEVSRATDVENGLTSNLSALVSLTTIQTSDISMVAGLVTAETSRATLAESTLTTDLATEVSRATLAEGTLTSALTSLVADVSLINTTIVTDRSDIMFYIQHNIGLETDRAQAAEASLASILSLNTEISRIDLLRQDLDAEISRAANAAASSASNLIAELSLIKSNHKELWNYLFVNNSPAPVDPSA